MFQAYLSKLYHQPRYSSTENVIQKRATHKIGLTMIAVSTPDDVFQDMKSDVYIAGTLVRNRALNADVVAVEILPREEWKVRPGWSALHKDYIVILSD